MRGLRKIEQAVLKRQKSEVEATAPCAAPVAESADRVAPAVEVAASANRVVPEYCTAVRGILNDDQGGPLQPPGLRMADALSEVRESIQRNLDEKRGLRGGATRSPERLHRPRSRRCPRRTKSRCVPT